MTYPLYPGEVTLYVLPPQVGASTGAHDRLMQSLRKLDDLYLDVVNDFGAVPDGVTDSTLEIQAAIDYAAQSARKHKVWIHGWFRVSQLLMRNGVYLEGPGVGRFANSTGYGGLIQQLSGTNADMIRFDGELSVPSNRWFAGPLGINGLELRGDGTGASTAGYGLAFRRLDGTSVTWQDTVSLGRTLIRGFRDGGVLMPNGALPGHLHDLNLLFNGGPGIDYRAVGNLTQALHFDNISGDGNIGSLIRCEGVDDRGSVSFTNIKSEMRINLEYGNAEGQQHVVQLHNCSGPVAVNGVTAISSIPDGANFKVPESVFRLTGSTIPKIDWRGVAVRVRPGDTGTAVLVKDEVNSLTVPITDVHSRYPFSAPATWLAPPGLSAAFGSPSLSMFATSRRLVWLFDASSNEMVATTLLVPSGWQKARVAVEWANAGAGSGAVAWVAHITGFAAGDSVNVSDAWEHGVTATAGSQYVVVHSEIATDLVLVPGQILGIRIERDASNGADTLANDAALLGVSLSLV